ncbi:MAG: NAD(P)/FAD-dependent oxidoreductase [Bacteroidetes bacterium]|nr:NAD(P)/FAD-dependent oxidoreductase [Bacteroidota bacterium]
MKKKLIVIGGGAAGFFTAVNAARMNPSLEVCIVEKSNKLLSKVKISGGGRCNTTHACFEIAELVKKYPRGQQFLKKAFHQFNTNHTIQWFAERNVTLVTEADGRMFPSTNDSQTIINCLLQEADKYAVKVLMQTEIKAIKKEDHQFQLVTSNEQQLVADYLCVACGGYPKSTMFQWLTNLGHTIETPVPSLFTFNMPGNKINQFMGLSVPMATVKIIGTKLVEQGPLLITHWGMSGPVILKLSAWGARILADASYRFKITVNWLSDYNEQNLRESWHSLRTELAAQKMGNKNPFSLPNRLWNFLLEQSEIKEDTRWADLPSKEQNKLIKNLTAAEFTVDGKTTFKEEFVTCGGIKLSEIDPNTMQSKKVDQLYFAGEIMDIDGVTGGFNFQNAWTSGWIAAKSISNT